MSPTNIRPANYNRLLFLLDVCKIYQLHRDFDLAKKLCKHPPMSWEKAEKFSNIVNQLVTVKQSQPQDFIKSEDKQTNEAIDAYINLKDYLAALRENFGVKYRDEIYRVAKIIYRKKIYCYLMDSFFCNTIFGYYTYVHKGFDLETFVEHFGYEYSLFNGKKTLLTRKKVFKIIKYIESERTVL